MDRWRSNGQLVPVAPDVGGGEVPRTNNRAEIFDRIRAREYAPNVDNAALRLPRHTFHFSCPPPRRGGGMRRLKEKTRHVVGCLTVEYLDSDPARESRRHAREREGASKLPPPPPSSSPLAFSVRERALAIFNNATSRHSSLSRRRASIFFRPCCSRAMPFSRISHLPPPSPPPPPLPSRSPLTRSPSPRYIINYFIN